MFSIFTNRGIDFCGAVSPFGDKYLSSSVPSDLPCTYTVFAGRPPEDVPIDVHDIRVSIVPAPSAKRPARLKTTKRRPAAKQQ